MNIKNPQAHALAKELAAWENTTVTQAVTLSLREALDRRRAEVDAQRRRVAIDDIADRFCRAAQTEAGPGLWQINEDLYDELGLPR